MNEPLPALLQRMLAWRCENEPHGRPARCCVVVSARGSTPQTAGAVMLVDETLQTYGTIGGGCVEAEVRRRAHELLSRDETAVMRFKLDHDYGWDDGLICGGTIEVAAAALPDVDAIRNALDAANRRWSAQLAFTVDAADGPQRYVLNMPARPRLFIAGAGHVGQALARLGLSLEFDVTVFDDRADLLERHLPDSARPVAGPIADMLAAEPLDDQTYCVIVTRGHRHDEQALEAVIRRAADDRAGYVGMIGSRRKVKLIVDDLTQRGVAPELLEQVRAPIGLPINAVTVEEIAVSIAAQLVQVRRGGESDDGRRIRSNRKLVEGPFPINAPTPSAAAGARP